MKEVFLDLLNGEKVVKRLKILGPKVVFGRLADCDIIINDTSVSRKHAEIIFNSPNTYILKDLNSSNGVFVNDDRINTHTLVHGDVFSIGLNTYRFIEKEKKENLALSSVKIPKAAKSGGNKKRIIIYSVLGLFVLLMLLATGEEDESKIKEKDNKVLSEKDSEEDDFLKDLDQKTGDSIKIDPGMEDFFKKANDFYFLGKRELRLNNNTRALDNFKKALTFYPKHSKARYFAVQTIRLIKKESKKHLQIGKRLLTQLRYDDALFHFNEVLNLNFSNTKSKLYKDAQKYIKITNDKIKNKKL